MKKELKSLFDAVFSKPFKSEEPALTSVVLNSYSQPHVLQCRMKEANLTHGQTVKADIKTVRLEVSYDRIIMYFCPSQEVKVNEHVSDGDGGAIPETATLYGFESILKGKVSPGLYDLKNVTLFSNGTMQVIAGEDTEFVPV